MGVLFGNVKLNIERVTFPPRFHFLELVLLVVLVVVLVLLLLEVVKGEARPKVKQNVYLIFLHLLSPYVFFQFANSPHSDMIDNRKPLAARISIIF